jgi:AraC family transcriptional regulator, regulatory protein of adaptative response / DNA-3-methyladenine glycosylase II
VTTYSAIVTTGIYCRPGCRAKPRAENVRTFELAAAAEAAGFRACLRCRPYRVAGPVGGDAPELVCRAIRLILDGELDVGTEASLAARIGTSPRHLRRLFLVHLGATADQLARSRRAHFARRLLDDTDLTVAEVAFASGFGSLRQFNRTMREVFRASPSDLRRRRQRVDRLVTDGGLALRLPTPPAYDWDAVRCFLAARAIPGVEAVEGAIYRRTISLDGAPGLLEIAPGDAGHLLLTAHLPYWEGLIHVVDRVSRLLGIDTDSSPGARHLAADPVVGRLVRTRPGLVVPGVWGPFEVGVRAVVDQDCSRPATDRLMGAIVTAYGEVVPGLPGGLTHAFPAPEALAGSDLASVGLPTPVVATVDAFARSVADGKLLLDGSTGLDDLLHALASIPGIDTSTAHHIALRLGYSDAFPAADPSLVAALAALGPAHPTAQTAQTEAWRPWRALAAVHLLASRDTVHE